MLTKEKVERDKGLDKTLNLLNEGYLFIKNRMGEFDCDIFETHILAEKAVCITGEEAARIFYDGELFQRKGVAPKRVQKTLFGVNAIQGMDGEAHLHRKQLFMSLMTKPHQMKLAELVLEKLEASIDKWEKAEEIVLFQEMRKILCEAVCFWAGVPLGEEEIEKRAEDFSEMIDGFGGIGPRYSKGRKARERSEEWMRGVIEDTREGKLVVSRDSVLFAMAFHREMNGKKLDTQMAAIELINILRPVVAISTYITFAALALHRYPECKEKLIEGKNNYSEMFAQEVRRYYPFTPFVGARAKKDFTWNDYEFKEGILVILDVYGINHDSRIWENPYNFEPGRFGERKENQFNFIPQGGGDPSKGHRCPGEGITVEIMKATVDVLVNMIEFKVPEQDLSYSLSRIPTLPTSGFIMNNVRRK